ncbi:Calcium uniporter protein [Aphelenchoides bicaudatus]|nr:Calcium uniporter protein [Aphelenchoides bicaudatus]
MRSLFCTANLFQRWQKSSTPWRNFMCMSRRWASDTKDYKSKYNSDQINQPSTSNASVFGNNNTIFVDKVVDRPSKNVSPIKLTVRVENGLPILEVPLPSREEKCRFILRPISDTIGSLCDYLKHEDKGVEIAAVYCSDGTRISRSVAIENLMLMPHFRLRLNDQYYEVSTPQANAIDARKILESSEKLKSLDDLRAKIATLYAVLNVDDFKLEREKNLLKRIEEVEQSLRPLEIIRKTIEEECERYSIRVLWFGFIAMGVQTGIFARLTWWEYSWDIVEPCTYFATFSTVFATFGYYIFTKQSFEYPTAERRFFTNQFHKRAVRYNFDIDAYNDLKRLSIELRHDLERIRDPLQQHLPATRLASLESEQAKIRWKP